MRGDSGNPMTTTEGIADTVLASASVAAPGAGATIAQLTGLVVGGVYKVVAALTLTGTAETQLANARLRQNGATIGAVPTLSAAGPIPVEVSRVTVGANGTVDLIAIAAATAGSVYTATLTATRVG